MILVDFRGNFPLFRLIFCYPDPFPFPDPAGRNETDPNGSGSETLHIIKHLNLVLTKGTNEYSSSLTRLPSQLEPHEIGALIISPTRELASQIR